MGICPHGPLAPAGQNVKDPDASRAVSQAKELIAQQGYATSGRTPISTFDSLGNKHGVHHGDPPGRTGHMQREAPHAAVALGLPFDNGISAGFGLTAPEGSFDAGRASEESRSTTLVNGLLIGHVGPF